MNLFALIRMRMLDTDCPVVQEQRQRAQRTINMLISAGSEDQTGGHSCLSP